MAFIIGNRQNAHSYQPLIDFGAVHSEGLSGFVNQNQQQIIDTVTEAIEEAACINNRQEEPVEEGPQACNYDWYIKHQLAVVPQMGYVLTSTNAFFLNESLRMCIDEG